MTEHAIPRITATAGVTSMREHRLTFSPRTDGPFEYDPSQVLPIANPTAMAFATKPFGGIWLSVDGGWERWCRNEMPHWLSNGTCEVTLVPGARIYEVRSMEDLERLPQRDAPEGMWLGSGMCPCAHIDFERMAKDYDGMFLNLSHGDPDFYFALYGWDCDSVLVFSADAIGQFGPLVADDEGNATCVA